MKVYNEEDFLLLSGIQHFAFCRRQWALIHIEKQWSENLRTVEGHLLHEKAHDRFSVEKRGNIIISRGISVHSRSLGICGDCDVVEFHKSPNGIPLHGQNGTFIPIPIEYKRGQPKENDADVLQLTAQAMCLEEMLCTKVETAYLYYGETKHRICIHPDDSLRTRVREAFLEMHSLYQRCYTPKVKRTKSCNACSLKEICLPVLCKNKLAAEYIDRHISGKDLQ